MKMLKSLKLPFGFSSRVVYGGPYYEKPDWMFGVKMASEIENPSDLFIPTKDFGTPNRKDLIWTIPIIIEHIARGEDVYVGCMGGLGRTGTLLALLAKTMGVVEPIWYVRENYDQRAIETRDQEEFIDFFDTTPFAFVAWKARGTAALADLSRLWGARGLLGRA